MIKRKVYLALSVIVLSFLGVFPSVCSASSWWSEEAREKVPVEVQRNQVEPQEYILGIGDKIRLTVYGETDLSGDYEISSTGVIALPLIGNVQAAGQSIQVFEKAVRANLKQGYLHDPRVSAEVVNYRPFFILGEVAKPGSYPYVNGMTILNAIALAGGYTYRADKTEVTVTRASNPNKKAMAAPEEMMILPGDIVRVPERFF